jgi:hypothetical protein
MSSARINTHTLTVLAYYQTFSLALFEAFAPSDDKPKNISD